MWWSAPLHQTVPTLQQVLQPALVLLFANKVHKARTARTARTAVEAEHGAEQGAAAVEAEHEAQLKRRLPQNNGWVKR